MSGAIVVGLTVATVLTLLVTPCALVLSDSLKDLPNKFKTLIRSNFLPKGSESPS